MTTAQIVAIIIAVVSSAGIWSFLQFVILRKSKLEEVAKAIEDFKAFVDSENKTIKRDNKRSQLLILMNHYATHHDEVMKVAYEYFVNLKGDWYMDSLFKEWLSEQGLQFPTWFKGE